MQTEGNARAPAGTEGVGPSRDRPPGVMVASLEAAAKLPPASPEASFSPCYLSQPQQMVTLKALCGAEEVSQFSPMGSCLSIFAKDYFISFTETYEL